MTAQGLKEEIENVLPEFAAACKGSEDLVLIHQAAFAAGCEEDEFTLLGEAIKYAGLFGKELRITARLLFSMNPDDLRQLIEQMGGAVPDTEEPYSRHLALPPAGKS